MIENFQIKYKKIPVEVSIKGITKIGSYIFIVDTGASYSIFDKGFIKTLGYSNKDYIDTINLQGVGGKRLKTSFIKLKSLTSLGLRRTNFRVGIMDFNSLAFYQGILGTDFFINHKLCIDFKKGTISLE